MLAGCMVASIPHGVPKLVDVGRSGAGEDFETEAGEEQGHLLPLPLPFFPVLPLFLVFFLADTFFGQIPSYPQLRGRCAVWAEQKGLRAPCSTTCLSGWRGLVRQYLTQQYAVNMCLNGARAKRFGCCYFPSETAALLKLKCFTV